MPATGPRPRPGRPHQAIRAVRVPSGPHPRLFGNSIEE